LRSDLAAVLGTSNVASSDQYGRIIVRIERRRIAPIFVLGAVIGLAMVGLALILMRRNKAPARHAPPR